MAFLFFNCHLCFANQRLFLILFTFVHFCGRRFVLVCWPCHGHIFVSLQWIWLMIMSEKFVCFVLRFISLLRFRSLRIFILLIFNNGVSTSGGYDLLRRQHFDIGFSKDISSRFWCAWLIDKIQYVSSIHTHMTTRLRFRLEFNAKNTISFIVIGNLRQQQTHTHKNWADGSPWVRMNKKKLRCVIHIHTNSWNVSISACSSLAQCE